MGQQQQQGHLSASQSAGREGAVHTYIHSFLHCALLYLVILCSPSHAHTYQLQHLLMYIVNGKGKNILMDDMLIMFNVQDTHFLAVL